MSRVIMDVKVAVRTVLRSRYVSVLATLAFALGIGVTTAVFSIFNGVLLVPLPYPAPDRLVVVYDTQPACSTCPASFPKYHDWKERSQVFSAIGGSMNASAVLTGQGEPVQLRGVATTASLGDVFGVRPQLGRWYTDEEDRPSGPKVVVLASSVWAQQFGRDPSILGRTLMFDGEPVEVIGVMPPSFTHRRAEYFVPLQRTLDPATRGSHFLVTYARLKPGVTLERATAEMRALGHTLAREFGHNHGVDVRSLIEASVGNVRAPLRVLLGAVFCVLLIACANVANLLLAFGLARRRELAIRLALGAGSRDLARQLTLESLVLSVAGGAFGVLLAVWIVRMFVGLAGTNLPRAATIAVDGRVLAFAAVVSLATGAFCGIWPLVMLRMSELAPAVREGDVRSGSASGRRFGNALVIAEMAMAFALLVGAGLLVKNLIALRNRDAGIRTDRLVSFNVSLSGPRYARPEQMLAFYRQLDQRLSGAPGVESLGMTSHLPMFTYGMNGEFQIEGGTPWKANDAPLVEYRWIFGDYLKTMGIRLLQGRALDDRERPGSKAVLINETMAKKFWPGKDPIGKRFGQPPDVSGWYEVVGVLSDVRSIGLAQNVPYEFYQTIAANPRSSMTVVVRTRSDDPTTIIPIARQAIAGVDSALPITEIQTVEHVVSESVGQPRLMSALTLLFALLAGSLAVVGVYGVMSYNVRKQRREYGIRVALGADPARVRNLVIGRGLALAIAGVAIGGLAAWMLSGVLKTMLNDVKPTDLGVFVATGVGLLMVAVAASYVPARSAGRVDPMIVLRDA